MHSGTRVSTQSPPVSTLRQWVSSPCTHSGTRVSTQSTPVSTLRSMRFQTAHAQRNPYEYSEYPCEYSEYPCEHSE
jgi:hypothetical protein